jgi:hypothetical protein
MESAEGIAKAISDCLIARRDACWLVVMLSEGTNYCFLLCWLPIFFEAFQQICFLISARTKKRVFCSFLWVFVLLSFVLWFS